MTSPTFVIARVHRDGRVPLVHVDAYRLGSVADVDDLDLDASAARVGHGRRVGPGPGRAAGRRAPRGAPRPPRRRRPHRRPRAARARLGAPPRRRLIVSPAGAVAGRRCGRHSGAALPSTDVLVLALDTATPTLSPGSPAGRPTTASRSWPSGPSRRATGTPSCSRRRSRACSSDAGVADHRPGRRRDRAGPGPFTGLRVGIVTALTLADARGLPVVGVCSLDAVGSGARTVVTDARRKEVYWAAYAADGRRTEGPGVVRPEDLGPDRPVRRRPGLRRAAGRPGDRRRRHDRRGCCAPPRRSWPTRRRRGRSCRSTSAARTRRRRPRSSRCRRHDECDAAPDDRGRTCPRS